MDNSSLCNHERCVFALGPADAAQIASRPLVIIDGDPGAGKTTLARKLAALSAAKVISTDDFIAGNGEPYWKQIDYESLCREVALPSSHIIVEGVCLLKILSCLHVKHSYHVFIKLRNGVLGWEYHRWRDVKAKPPRGQLARDILEYYREYRPFDVCDRLL